VYHNLRRHLRQRQNGGGNAAFLGLSEAQCAALISLTWRPHHELLLAFRDDCALPHSLHLGDGMQMPVRAVRAVPGRLQTWFRARNDSRNSLIGTLTALVRGQQTEQFYALTAGHVVASASTARAGDHIILHENGGRRVFNSMLKDWTPSFYAGRLDTPIDAGLAALPLEQARDLINSGLRLPTGVSETTIGDRLSLLTRSLTIPSEILGQTSALLHVGADDAQLSLMDGWVYQADNTPQAGDSGAPLWNSRERLAAMHVAGELSTGVGNGVAISISSVLNWCKCDVLERSAPLQARLPAISTTAQKMAAIPVSPQVGDAQLTLARTLWGEARGEGVGGMEAIACVVLNRVRRQTYWGKSVTEVCRKPYQFSCWNANDPNSAQLLRLTADAPALAEAMLIAGRAIANQLGDSTTGATHYHASRLSPVPRWARGHAICAQIGNHFFYNDID
jgi:hypothetical protein